MILVSTLLFLIIMMLGGVVCTIWGKGTFEEGLPIGQCLLVLTMFFFGIAGFLRLSVVVILIFCIAIIAYVMFRLCNKSYDFSKRLFTPAFFAYIIMGIGLLALNYGKMFCAHDEFSHWGDIVHGMSTTGLMSFEPELCASFPEYVPGVSLIEYLLTEITRLLGGDFTEWQLYYAFQLFLFSTFFPFFSRMNFKKPLPYFSIGSLFLLQTFFQNNVYTTIYVDVILSVFYGVGMAMLFQKEERNSLWHIRLILTISLLPLVKNTGLLFALSLFICYAYEQLQRREKGAISLCLGCFSMMTIPTILWNILVQIKGVKQAFGFSALLSPTIKNSVYPADTVQNFIKALLTRNIASQSAIAQHISSVACFVGLFILVSILTKRNTEPKRHRFTLLVIGLTGLAYITGICIIMCFSFTDEELSTLSSFERYINVYFNALALTSLLLSLNYVAHGILQMRNVVIPFAICTIFFTPFSDTARFLTRRTVASSQQYRSYSVEIRDKFQELGIDEGRVLMIFDNYDYMEHIIMRSTLRPLTVSVDGLSSITSDELKKQYDYILLYRIDKDFSEKNSVWFEDENDICEGGIYKPIGDNNKLVQIDAD